MWQAGLTNSSSSRGVTTIPCREKKGKEKSGLQLWLFVHYCRIASLQSQSSKERETEKKNCLTKKLPKAELKMAAACTNTHSVYHFGDTAGLIWPANLCVCVTSLPPTALVRITAEETGGGMQLTVCNLGNHNNHRVKKKEEDEDETDLSHCLPPQRKLWGWRNVFHKWEKQNKTMQYDVTQTGLQVGGACVRLRWPY